MLTNRLRSPNGEGSDRPRPFIIIAIWAGFVLAENRGGTVRRAQVSSGTLCYALVLGSLSCLLMVSGGVFFPLKKSSLRSENRAEFRGRGNRGTALRNTTDCHLRCKCRSRRGAYTSLDRTRIWCICLLAGIVMIGKDRVSVAIRAV